MSELGGGASGRASSGGARTTGHVPVPSPSPGLRTPRDIMKDREAREARKRAEAEQAKRIQEKGKRGPTDKGPLAMGAATPGRESGSQSRSKITATPAAPSQQTALTQERIRTGQTPQVAGRAYETTHVALPVSRLRGSSRSQEEPQTSAAPPAARRTLPTQGGLRQSSAPASTMQAAEGTAPVPTQQPRQAPQPRDNVSAFPHAFERWEQLSSHWEGLTSYWLHKLESNQEEIARIVPSASAMSRQITDLSAAGANLFHAVVELQRLRASSERKFQRWFIETRAEQEQSQELQAELEKLLQLERDARAEEVSERTRLDQYKRNVDKMVNEMRRELLISKEEARRAWEELGRREQEERERTASLRDGMPTVVGGVQVVPMHASAGVSRQDSESQRQSSTRGDAQYQASQGTASRHREQIPEQEYEEGSQSPTDTDPFTETGRNIPHARHETNVPTAVHQPYPLGSEPATSGTTFQTAIPPSQQRLQAPLPHPPEPTHTAPTTQSAPATGGPSQTAVRLNPAIAAPVAQERPVFYQHSPTETFLHSPHSSSSPAEDIQEQPASQAQPTYDLRPEHSYTSTISNDEPEYEIDSSGNLRLDPQGQPLVYRQGQASSSRRAATRTSESDEYDVEADIARERELTARYGVSGSSGSAEAAPRTLSVAASQPAATPPFVTPATEAAPGYDYVTSSSAAPDYEGQGFTDWEALQTRHHHPTRLSDVMEEEEEGRSRTSRASRATAER